MRGDKKIFKSDENIAQICNIILQTNGYYESQIPGWIELILIKEALSEYLKKPTIDIVGFLIYYYYKLLYLDVQNSNFFSSKFDY